MIEMNVAGIALDAITRSPIVLLKDGSDRRALPIYIGQDQARAIIAALENQTTPSSHPRSDRYFVGDVGDEVGTHCYSRAAR